MIEPKRSGERDKRTEYPERWSFREVIREAIDVCMERKPKDMDELLKLLQNSDQKKFVRFRSLGAGYREEDLERVFAGEVIHKPDPKKEKFENIRDTISEKKIDMLVDIQKIIAKGKGPGYERWAKVHNIKQMAQTLLFLQEHDLRDYDELAKRAQSSVDRFNEISARQKKLEGRLSEIVELKKHSINYSKTREVYVAYRKSGYSRKFFEEHRKEITLHKAAKDAFSKIEGKIPRIKALNAEYEMILSEKRKAYAEYREARQEMKDYQTAKYNIDRFLERESVDQERDHQKERKREEPVL